MKPKALYLVAALLLGVSAGAMQADAPGIWATLAPMPSARQEVSTAALKGKIYVIAGFDAGGNSTDAVEVYNPATNTWSRAASLPIATNHNAAAVADGKLYAFGGTSNRVFVYNRSGNSWSEVAPMRFPHGNTPAVAVIADRIYVAGGTGPGMTGNEVEVYDPVQNTWTTLAPMKVPRNHTAGGAINGKFYVVGGRGSPDAASAFEVYDPQTNAWDMLPPLPTGRSGIAAGVLNGKLYVFGGELPRLFGDVEVYDPAENSWQPLPPMPTPRHGIFGAVIGNTIYMPGGGIEQGLGPSNVNDAFKLPPVILNASVDGKKLFITGENFDEEAAIFLNGERQKTKSDESDPTAMLIGKKAGKKIGPGQTVTLQVENGDGTRSPEFRFTRP